MKFNIEITGEQLQVVMNALAEGRFSVVQPIIASIMEQAERQQKAEPLPNPA